MKSNNKQKIAALIKKYNSIQNKQCDPIEKEIRKLLASEYPRLSADESIDWACDLTSGQSYVDVFLRMDDLFKK